MSVNGLLIAGSCDPHARQMKVSISALEHVTSGEKVDSLVPVVTPSSTAQEIGSSYQLPEGTSVKFVSAANAILPNIKDAATTDENILVNNLLAQAIWFNPFN